MIKASLSVLGLALLTGTSYHVCTEIGFQTKGSHEVVVEVLGRPSYESVGQCLYAPDGNKLLVNAISRGNDSQGAKHEVRATVYGTHRYSLALFPARCVHAFSMDRPAVERTIKEAIAMKPEGLPPAPHRRWHLIP